MKKTIFMMCLAGMSAAFAVDGTYVYSDEPSNWNSSDRSWQYGRSPSDGGEPHRHVLHDVGEQRAHGNPGRAGRRKGNDGAFQVSAAIRLLPSPAGPSITI